MEQKITSSAVKGLFLALIMIVFTLILQYSGQGQNTALGLLSFCIYMGGIIWGCTYYAKQMAGNVTFGNVFAHGFKMAAATTAIMVVFIFLLFTFISPELKDEAMKKMEEKLMEQNASDEQMEMALNMTKKYFTVFTVGGQLFFLLLAGLIAALIGAAVAKKNPQSPFQQG
jgi:hypothetical protein